jgi:hypothetical protein
VGARAPAGRRDGAGAPPAAEGLARTPPGTPEHLALRLAAEEDYVDRRHDRITELLPAAADPVLGEELGASVQTGSRCCYRPEITVRVGGPPA